MSVPYWEDQPRLWDVVKIGGIALPGVAIPTGGVGRKIDTAEVPGSDTGATQTDLGYEGSAVTVRVRMWTQAHLDAYAQIVKKFRPRRGESKPKPVDVIHPALAVLEIRLLTIQRMGVPEPSQEAGIYEASIEFLEFISEVKEGKAEEKLGGGGGSGGIFGNIEDMPYAGSDAVAAAGAGGLTTPTPATIGPQLPTPPAAPPASTIPGIAPGLTIPGFTLPGN